MLSKSCNGAASGTSRGFPNTGIISFHRKPFPSFLPLPDCGYSSPYISDEREDELYKKSLAAQFADRNLMDMSPISLYGILARDQFLRYSHFTSQYLGKYISAPYLYQVGNVLLLGTMHIAPLWSIPEYFLEIIKSKDRLYVESYSPEPPILPPPDEPEFIKYYSYQTEQLKTIPDLTWFERLSVETQNTLTYFLPLDWLNRSSAVQAIEAFYALLQSNCSKTFPFPWHYLGMDQDLIAHYDERCEGLESPEALKPIFSLRGVENNIPSPLSILMLRNLVTNYCHKNTSAFIEFSNNSKQNMLMKEMLQGRTSSWMSKIKDIISKGENALIAVGVGHLFGEDGILSQLSQAGYEVLDVCCAHAAACVVGADEVTYDVDIDLEDNVDFLGKIDGTLFS